MEPVEQEESKNSLLPGEILVRVFSFFLVIGTFSVVFYLALKADKNNIERINKLKAAGEQVIERHDDVVKIVVSGRRTYIYKLNKETKEVTQVLYVDIERKIIADVENDGSIRIAMTEDYNRNPVKQLEIHVRSVNDIQY